MESSDLAIVFVAQLPSGVSVPAHAVLVFTPLVVLHLAEPAPSTPQPSPPPLPACLGASLALALSHLLCSPFSFPPRCSPHLCCTNKCFHSVPVLSPPLRLCIREWMSTAASVTVGELIVIQGDSTPFRAVLLHQAGEKLGVLVVLVWLAVFLPLLLLPHILCVIFPSCMHTGSPPTCPSCPTSHKAHPTSLPTWAPTSTTESLSHLSSAPASLPPTCLWLLWV